jgi:iron complex outermembrane recepter protein
MKNFNLKPLGVIISGLVLVAANQSALAQNTETNTEKNKEEVVDEIVVTGFAKSIATAIETKRKADTVIEAISAEDIGGLPDKSIADSLSRLPGITVTRKGGQAGTIQIRGMGEGYVFSTMNGREQVSPSGARAMEYSQFPSELISSVEVYKSPKASLIEGGVAGTVELKTVNPLDLKDDHLFTVGLRGTYNDQASDLYDADAKGHRISFSYQQKLLDDTLGFSLGYAQLKEPKSQLQFEMFNYDTLVAGATPAESTWTSQGLKVLQDSGVSQRDGYMAAIQFSPSDEFKVQADAFYSKFEVDSNGRGIWANGIHNAKRSGITYFDGFVETGANISNATDKGTFGVRTIIDNKQNENELFSGGIKFEWQRDAFTAKLDLSHSDASGFELNGNGVVSQFKSVPVTDTTPSGLVVDSNQQLHYQLDGINVPSITTTADLTNTSKLWLNQQSLYPYANEDKIDAVRLDLKYELDLPVLSSVEVGARASKRNHIETRSLLRYGDAGIASDYPLAISENTSDVVTWSGAFKFMPAFLAVDAKTILADAYAAGKVLLPDTAANAYDGAGKLRARSQALGWRWGNGSRTTNNQGESVPDTGSAWSLQQNADIDENVKSAYLQANISTTIADRDLTGNIGVRYVKTEQSNYSLADFNGVKADGATEICDIDGVCLARYGYTSVSTEYSNTLPSLNLLYQVTDVDQVRLALARVLSRAPIRQLASFDFGSVAVVGGVPTYNYGDTNSPLLRPFIADQIDLSYEHYLEDTNGSITVAAYYRKIQSFIQSLSQPNFDFAANNVGSKPENYVVTSAETGNVPTELPVVDGTYRYALNNDKGGFIKGLEIAYTQTFNFLPSYWSGLGFSGSASFTDSAISIARPANSSFDNADIPFPGLVEQSFNFTLFYTYEGFETRLSTTFQDSFVGESRTIGPTVVPVTYAAETVMDFQAKYKLDNGLDFIFSVGNLTNEPNRSYMFDEALPLKLNWFGRTFALGANYSF